MSTGWLWRNRTQVGFGNGCVQEHLGKFIKEGSKVLCTFGGGSIDKNGARADVQSKLDELKCEVRWEGGIPANPEYERCMEIVAVVREWKPDVILAVGGGSTLDGSKFICLASALPPEENAFEKIMIKREPPACGFCTLGSVMTLPATGSEWNSGFVISWRAKEMKLGGGRIYPTFSLLDPRYTETLPQRQLRNGVYDAMTHCLDQVITGKPSPLMDKFWFGVMKELIEIGKDVVYHPTEELRGRLIVAASFALNEIFTLGKETCWGIHGIGHQLTVKYGIDHGSTLAMVSPAFLEELFESRKVMMAQAAEYVFGVHEGSEDEKARAFIAHLREFIKEIGQTEKVTDWPNTKVEPGDVDCVTKMVMASMGGKPFGWNKEVTEPVVRAILAKVVL